MSTFPGKHVSPAVQALWERAQHQCLALTFDDVTLADQPSSVHPNDVALGAWLTRKYYAPTPILAAAMDTVCEQELALAIARCGGVGILHRNLSAQEQAKQVRWVRSKVHSGGLIERPICFQVSDRLSDVQAALEKHQYHFTSFPILDGARFCGMLTRDELAFAGDADPRLDALMLRREEVTEIAPEASSSQAYALMKTRRVKKLPVVEQSSGALRGMWIWRDLCQNLEREHDFALDEEGHFLVGAAISTHESDLERARALIAADCKLLVLDSSHGASAECVQQIRRLRAEFGERCPQLIAGNVASYASAAYLLSHLDALPDALKCGIGPGSICTTRTVTGHGVPQLTALAEVHRAVRESNHHVPIIADGGVSSSGAAIKCLAFGASAIMLGSYFAGADESPSERVTRNGVLYKGVRGMASASAMQRNSGSRTRYFAQDQADPERALITKRAQQKLVPEGVEGLVRATGPLAQRMQELLGGMRSGLAHSGAKDISEFQPMVWQQSVAGTREGSPHDIVQL